MKKINLLCGDCVVVFSFSFLDTCAQCMLAEFIIMHIIVVDDDDNNDD